MDACMWMLFRSKDDAHHEKCTPKVTVNKHRYNCYGRVMIILNLLTLMFRSFNFVLLRLLLFLLLSVRNLGIRFDYFLVRTG